MINIRLLPALLLLVSCNVSAGSRVLDNWTSTERVLISSLLIDNLGPLALDPSNKYADSPIVAKLGKKIFNDQRFSVNSKVSCSSCHQKNYNFTDKLMQAKGVGLTSRRSMSIVGVAYQRWFFWDGRNDSLWSQALAPLENAVEHGISRTRVAQLIFKHYRKVYQQAFDKLPNITPDNYPVTARPDNNDTVSHQQWLAIPDRDKEHITRIFVNTGKAIAAFVRTLKPAPALFDIYARAVVSDDSPGLNSLNAQQKKGLRLFIGKGKCINCHNGPLLSNGEFHHIGVPDKIGTDFGRSIIINNIINNEFSCMSQWSDADPKTDCAHVRFLDADVARYLRAFKTPSLRDVATRPPYMHAGQFDTLSGVLKHYRQISGTELADEVFHDHITDEDIDQLVAFLNTLTSLNNINAGQ